MNKISIKNIFLNQDIIEFIEYQEAIELSKILHIIAIDKTIQGRKV